MRTYTLSDASNRQQYRITVKREGVASSWLHEHFAAGMQVEAMAPRGAFTYDSPARALQYSFRRASASRR